MRLGWRTLEGAEVVGGLGPQARSVGPEGSWRRRSGGALVREQALRGVRSEECDLF